MGGDINKMSDNWKIASETLAKIKRGEITATNKQVEKLESLIEGHKAQQEAEFELRKGYIGLLYEKHVYQSKLSLIEKLGVTNKWKHPLLAECKEIIYQESENYQISDFMSSNE